jgi:hypothetical protein
MMSACGQKTSHGSTASPSISGAAQSASNAPGNELESIQACQVKSVTDFVSKILSSGLPRPQIEAVMNGRSGSVSFEQSVPCPGGGSAKLKTSHNVSYRVGFPISSASLDNGLIALEFNQCQVRNCARASFLIVDGSSSVGNLASSASVNVTSLSFNSQAQATLAGQLQIKRGTASLNCTLNLLNAVAASGAVRVSPRGATVTINALTSGTACGFQVNSSVQNQTVQVSL